MAARIGPCAAARAVGNPTPPEEVMIHDKAAKVADMQATWAALGLTFPDLTRE